MTKDCPPACPYAAISRNTGEHRLLNCTCWQEHAPSYSQDQAYHALTDGTHKNIWRPADGTEHLFDLEKDPHEECVLLNDEDLSETLKTWRTRLIQHLADRPEGFSRNDKRVPECDYKPLNISEWGRTI